MNFLYKTWFRSFLLCSCALGVPKHGPAGFPGCVSKPLVPLNLASVSWAEDRGPAGRSCKPSIFTQVLLFLCFVSVLKGVPPPACSSGVCQVSY